MATEIQPGTGASSEAKEEEQAEVTRSYSGLLAAVILMGVLIVIGFVVIVVTLVMRAMGPGDSAETVAPQHFGAATIPIRKEDRVGAFVLDGDRLAVRIETREGTEIVLIDPETGREEGRIRFAPLSDFAETTE